MYKTLEQVQQVLYNNISDLPIPSIPIDEIQLIRTTVAFKGVLNFLGILLRVTKEVVDDLKETRKKLVRTRGGD